MVKLYMVDKGQRKRLIWYFILSVIIAYPLAAIEYGAFNTAFMWKNPDLHDAALIFGAGLTIIDIISVVRYAGYIPEDETGLSFISLYYIIIPTALIIFLLISVMTLSRQSPKPSSEGTRYKNITNSSSRP